MKLAFRIFLIAVIIYNTYILVDIKVNEIKRREYVRGYYNCLAIVSERLNVKQFEIKGFKNLPSWDECDKSRTTGVDLYNHFDKAYMINIK